MLLVKRNRGLDLFNDLVASEPFLEPFRGLVSKGSIPYNVISDEESYHFTFELPGVTKKDIDISYQEDVLSVKSERKDVVLNKESQLLSQGIATGLLETHLTVPGIDFDKANAEFKDGILSLQIPKSEDRKQRTLTIK